MTKEKLGLIERERIDLIEYERMGSPESVFRERYQQCMAKIEDMPAKQAVDLGLAYRCPTCELIHPGLQYAGSKKIYCSPRCYRLRS